MPPSKPPRPPGPSPRRRPSEKDPRPAQPRPAGPSVSPSASQSTTPSGNPSGNGRSDTRLLKIAGLPAVAALFARDPRRVERLFFTDALKGEVGGFCTQLAAARKPYRLVPPDELERIAGTPLHGGVVAVAPARPVLPLDLTGVDGRARVRQWAAAGQPLLVLDTVGNPHNLGAIVRTCAFFGITRVLLSDGPGQAGPSESAYRVAEGGFEHVTLYRLSPFIAGLERLGRHYRVVGTALGDHRPLSALTAAEEGGTGDAARRRPVVLVMGNEEVGLGPDTLAACTETITIRGSGKVQSLNVAATAAILVHALAETATPAPAV